MERLINNTISSVGLAVTGTLAPLIHNNLRIHPFIMDSFQVVSYTGAITIAAITVYKFYKEPKK